MGNGRLIMAMEKQMVVQVQLEKRISYLFTVGCQARRPLNKFRARVLSKKRNKLSGLQQRTCNIYLPYQLTNLLEHKHQRSSCNPGGNLK